MVGNFSPFAEIMTGAEQGELNILEALLARKEVLLTIRLE